MSAVGSLGVLVYLVYLDDKEGPKDSTGSVVGGEAWGSMGSRDRYGMVASMVGLVGAVGKVSPSLRLRRDLLRNHHRQHRFRRRWGLR